ncbi:MAG: helix-turn-helix domain-containing protein [Adlercreutzia equolifaciens]
MLAYLAEGHSGAYISDVLFISPNTVRTHIHNIYRKLDVSSREDILRLTKG